MARRTVTVALVVVAGGTLLGARSSWGEDAADLILRHGRFHTVAATGPAVVDGALATRGGRIVAIGTDATVMAFQGKATRIIDLAGRAVTPGWIDAHSHLLGLGRALESVDLRGTRDAAELVARVGAAAATRPPGSWIYGRGWDQNPWPDREFPRHEELSRAVPEHPVWLARVDGHAAFLNAKAMQILGLAADVADPPGGRFLRQADGRLTGVLVDEAMGTVSSRLPAPSPADAARWLDGATRHALERGLTTVTEMGIDGDATALYLASARAGALGLRVAVFLADEKALLDDWLARGPHVDPGGRLLVRGIKMYADGALGSRGAALLEPYTDDPANLGLLITGADHVAEVTERALDRGFQVGVHAIGDRGNLVALDGLERALGGERGERPDARLRIEHAQVMRPQDIERMARLGVIASMQPTHATSDMPWAERRVGPRRIEGAYAWRRVLDAGGRLALGSDFPVEAADPLLGFHAAITRADPTGNPAGGWRAKEKLTRDEALRGFTRDAAWSLFLEDEVGSLEVGKRADLVVFDRDPMTVPEADIPGLRIEWTIFDGAVVYERSPVPGAR